MPRRLLAVLATAGALAAFAPASHASTTCRPLGPVPGREPVCGVKCAIGFAAQYVDALEPFSERWPYCSIQD